MFTNHHPPHEGCLAPRILLPILPTSDQQEEGRYALHTVLEGDLAASPLHHHSPKGKQEVSFEAAEYRLNQSAIRSSCAYTVLRFFLFLSHLCVFLLSISIIVVAVVEHSRYSVFYHAVLDSSQGLHLTIVLMSLSASFLLLNPILFFLFFVAYPEYKYHTGKKKVLALVEESVRQQEEERERKLKITSQENSNHNNNEGGVLRVEEIHPSLATFRSLRDNDNTNNNHQNNKKGCNPLSVSPSPLSYALTTDNNSFQTKSNDTPNTVNLLTNSSLPYHHHHNNSNILPPSQDTSPIVVNLEDLTSLQDPKKGNTFVLRTSLDNNNNNTMRRVFAPSGSSSSDLDEIINNNSHNNNNNENDENRNYSVFSGNGALNPLTNEDRVAYTASIDGNTKPKKSYLLLERAKKAFVPLPLLVSPNVFTHLHLGYLVVSNVLVLVVFFLVVFGALGTTLANFTSEFSLEDRWADVFYYGSPAISVQEYQEEGLNDMDYKDEGLYDESVDPLGREMNQKLCQIQLFGKCSGGATLCDAEQYLNYTEAHRHLCPYCEEQAKIATFTRTCADRYKLDNAYPITYFTLCGIACGCVLFNIIVVSVTCHCNVLFVFSYRRYVQQLHTLMRGDLGIFKRETK
ncbi:hypothetical protein AGDE_13042 [Angomonas deanei]|uniref:Uncharacterized protein n=1 Tax=Angomonas deanei TaxID=59799 RepID=A0A7G2C7B0_9TRYP|nr:hypothetical protein AGDE_13042 [Angomonas deanei]CAD2215636.1 hypothetical protein, conserved [Angomonas deanei]|eukprot:EPY22823.1 hypothetical protein AGDE_13042 [Angomonas deanei]